MKRIIVLIALLLLVGCAKVEKVEKAEPINVSRFMEVENMGAWRIVADRQTGVMYAVSNGGYNIGTFTLLVDADGKPLPDVRKRFACEVRVGMMRVAFMIVVVVWGVYGLHEMLKK